MKKLKNIDFKGLFINHGEKIGMGFIMLIVLTVLSTTSWSRTDKTPEQLKTLVTTASDKITSPQNVWPAAKAEQFALVNFNGQAQEVLAGVSTSKYEFATPMFWPLYRKREKAREPDLVVPVYLIAEGGECVLQVNTMNKGMLDPANAMAGGAGTGTAPATGTTDSPDSTLKPVAGNPATTGPGTGPVAAGAHGGGSSGPSPMGIKVAQPPQSGPRRPPAPSGGHGSAPPPTMEGSGMQMASSGIEARGKRFVAVRAIVPIKEQIERVMKALNLSYAEASSLVEYTDFVLQRQTAVPGPNPWPSDDKWETVNIDTAMEILRETADFDPDPVPSDLQDAVFTMPLPYRLLRYWGDLATHPNIKQFRLSEEEMQREMKLQAKLVEEAEKLMSQTPQGVQKSGFLRPGATGAVVNDMRQMARNAISSSDANSMMNSMASYMNEGAGGPRMGAADIKNRLTASGRLYLFRYFDFDVEPGMAYRYRLQLKLRNPNFGRPHEEVEHESVRTGEVRETGFSNISNVATVPQSVKYFVKDVDRNKKMTTTVSIFEWHSELGTILADTIDKLSIGNFIGAKKKTLVLDPATPSFEEKEVTFETNDMLVDAASDIEISVDQHPDLKLKPERSKTARVGTPAEVLVLTNFGELKKLDSGSDTRTEQQLKQGVDEERKGYLYLKDAPRETTGALDGSGLYPGGMPGMGPGPAPGPGKKNPRKAGMQGGAYGSGPVAPSPPGGTRPPARTRA